MVAEIIKIVLHFLIEVWQKSVMKAFQTTTTLWSYFSCVRKLGLDRFSLESNQSMYFDDFSTAPLGTELKAEVCLEKIEPQQNKQELNKELSYWSMGQINDKPEFKGLVPSLENISKVVGDRLILHGWRVQSVKVLDEPYKSASFNFQTQEYTYTKSFKLNCVHRHHNPELTAEENLQLYNKCSRIHGHEYKVYVRLTSQSLNEYGVIASRSQLAAVLKEYIQDPFDKTFLNEKIGNTSGEIIGERFFNVLKPHLADMSSLKVRETRKNSFEISDLSL